MDEGALNFLASSLARDDFDVGYDSVPRFSSIPIKWTFRPDVPRSLPEEFDFIRSPLNFVIISN